MYEFRTKIPSLQAFDEYVERDLDTIETSRVILRSIKFEWQEKNAGLVLSILIKGR